VLTALVLAPLFVASSACSVIVAGKLDEKSAAADAAAADAGSDGGASIDGDTTLDLGDGGVSCTATVDGKACELPSGVAAVCASEECVESTCGDTVVDLRTETCDDGNPDPGDGCEPTTCAFTCASDSECSDGNDCNGLEACALATHRCELGEAPLVGAPCTTEGGAAGECNAAKVCAPEGCGNGVTGGPAEDCDDMNTINADGCDNDCTFSCTVAADCDDGNVCNGDATCNTIAHTCAAGTVLDCADASACTANECDAVAGCRNPLIDADGDGQAATMFGGCGTDCNDTNPASYVGAEELCDTVDNDCDGMTDESAPTWYVDCDGDTFASSMTGAMSNCMMPSATATGCPVGTARTWTSRRPIDTSSTDCYDANANVRPNQSLYFRTAASGRPAASDFDYNCDTVETRQYTAFGIIRPLACGVDSRGNCTGSYWIGSLAPACGDAASYSECASDGFSGPCTRSTITSFVQRCR